MHKVNLYIVTKGNIKYATGYWSYVLETVVNGKNYTKDEKGMECQVTRNSIELIALYRSLKRLTKPCHTTIYTASPYLFGVINNNWLDTWQSNNWRTAKDNPVKNAVFWSEIWQQSTNHKLQAKLCQNHSYRKWQEKEIKSLENVDFTKWEG